MVGCWCRLFSGRQSEEYKLVFTTCGNTKVLVKSSHRFAGAGFVFLLVSIHMNFVTHLQCRWTYSSPFLSEVARSLHMISIHTWFSRDQNQNQNRFTVRFCLIFYLYIFSQSVLLDVSFVQPLMRIYAGRGWFAHDGRLKADCPKPVRVYLSKVLRHVLFRNSRMLEFACWICGSFRTKQTKYKYS